MNFNTKNFIIFRFLLDSPKANIFQKPTILNNSNAPFQSSKDIYFQTPNRIKMESPQNHPDLSCLFNQKLAYFSNCIKNFVLSSSKIQKILSQKADDPETQFALKLFDEDKRQIERFLQKMDAVI